jgi:HD-GYP domain-containing protein (c-di-GMP phosphodiesterase class II)
MNQIEVREAKPGMKLAQAVFTRDGSLLVDAGTVLSSHTLDLLDLWGVFLIDVEPPQAEPAAAAAVIEKPAGIDEAAREKNKKRLGDLGLWVRTETRRILTTIQDVRGDIDAERLKQVASSIVDETFNGTEMMVSLTTIFDFDTYLFSHSVHVSILSTVVGISMGLTRKEIGSLATGCLVIDIGMLDIDRKIWDKTTALSDAEFQVVKRHPELGLRAAERLVHGDQDALAIVSQHHERIDGSGYPKRLQGKAIHPLARIAAVCDIYDAMQAPRAYRKKWLPYQVMSHLLVSSTETLDSEVVKVFLRTLSAYPIGSFIRLDTGEVAVVVSSNAQSPIRPVVKVFTGPQGNRLPKPVFIDLIEDRRFIIGPVDPRQVGVTPFEVF